MNTALALLLYILMVLWTFLVGIWFERKRRGPLVVIGTTPSAAPTARELVPDPSGARAGFHNLIRPPMVEIPEDDARKYLADGSRPVYGHPFDPIPLSHFDHNGFQQWTKDGGRVECLRFYIGPAPRLGPHEFRGSVSDLNFRGCQVAGCGRGITAEIHTDPPTSKLRIST